MYLKSYNLFLVTFNLWYCWCAKKITFHPEIRTKSITLDLSDIWSWRYFVRWFRSNNNNILEQTQVFNKLLRDLNLLERRFGKMPWRIKCFEKNRSRIIPAEYQLVENKMSQLKAEIKKNSYFSVWHPKTLKVKKWKW